MNKRLKTRRLAVQQFRAKVTSSCQIPDCRQANNLIIHINCSEPHKLMYGSEQGFAVLKQLIISVISDITIPAHPFPA